ncbi:MAG: hypothetical protein A2234_06010 [Elusimicrobia bacterium RIFOXYA2_FULL_58_8]|nr:MAG: hypothetical protein A2234_06010 [Elusimicrobia bacterium RIFOXYA2_FULL_58_8]OGS13377.1 MAG: hypothetical protein A2285_05300 [Elusimicrobia bacterium RIFOXYA12_FULL_57_11]
MLPVFIAGLCAGYLFKTCRPADTGGLEEKIQVRQQGYRFISPLLECENSTGLINVLIKSFKKEMSVLISAFYKSGEISDAVVYFRDLNNGPWYGFREQEKFRPASFLKIPIAMAIYKAAEDDPAILKKRVMFSAEVKMPGDRVQTIIPPRKLETGRDYTVEYLVEAMLRYSDNQAIFLLSRAFPNEYLFELYKHLGIEDDVLDKIDGQLSMRAYATFYRILFNASYLSRKYSEKILFFLSESAYKNALAAGVPAGTAVAHKFGEGGALDAQRQLQDCGIVYYPGRPYLLCVMAKGKNLKDLEKFIETISRFVYNNVNLSVKKEKIQVP